MKTTAKFLVLIFVMLMLNPKVDAQPKLWGTLPTAGNTETGIIYEIGFDGSGYNMIHDFSKFNGRRPRGHLVLADNGKFYGLAEGGFSTFGSVLFEYDPETNVYIVKHDFFDPETSTSASANEGSLIQASNGKLYGVTQNGGTYYDGQLFEFDIETNTFSVKVEFEELSKGKTPIGSMTEAANGKLYGVTYEGGTYHFGVLYEYDPGSNIFVVLKSFNGLNQGARPYDGVIQASNGKLYGLTREGGIWDYGVIYEFNITTNAISKIHDFNGTATGANPTGKLFQASNGMLYGMAPVGGTLDFGVIYEYDIGTSVFTKKFDFNELNGEDPSGSFTELADGYLYAMTAGGGVSDRGVLFRYDPGSNDFMKLLDFYGEDYGEYPYGSLTADANGKLYGMTWHGGVYPTSGLLFEYDPVAGIFIKKFDFMSAPSGAMPYGSLMKASDGQIYGMTSEGGSLLGGTIYKYDPDEHAHQVVYNFDFYNNGGFPSGRLIEASNGLLYGMADGGSTYDGVIFAFDPATSSSTVLHNFDDIIYGKDPKGDLLEASNGKLYGMTKRGGTNQDGVIFEYNIATSTFIKLFDFLEGTFGKNPRGSLIQATNGKLYGLTYNGGSFDKGVLFEYDPLTYDYTVKFHFDGTNKGASPYGSLLEFGDNQLFGLTVTGGVDGMGVLFVYDAESESYSKLLNFDGANTGAFPMGSLMLASNDKLYGTTNMGGLNNYGVVFEYDPAENLLTVIHHFTEYKDSPRYGSFIEVESAFGVDQNNAGSPHLIIYPNPVRDIINIKFDPQQQGLLSIRILNNLGQVVHEQETILSGSSTICIDTEYFVEGIYFLQFKNDKGQAYTRKFMKSY